MSVAYGPHATADGRQGREPRRIAVFRALYLGDLLVAVPALRALRATFPGAEVTLIGLPWAAAFAARFRRYIDRFVEFPGSPGIAEAPYDAGRTAQFIAGQRAYHYDLAVQMHGSGGASNPFVTALGAAMTIGYFEPGQGGDHGLTRAAPHPTRTPEVITNLALLNLLPDQGDCPETTPAGLPCVDCRLEFPLGPADEAEAQTLVPGLLQHQGSYFEVRTSARPQSARGIPCDRSRRPAPLIGIHAGARAPSRRWPAPRFAAVADRLACAYGARIVLTGSADERETVAAVAGHMSAPAINLAGKTSLGGLAAIIARLDLLICNDSGPLHLADALGTPSIALFGPADPLRWAPLDTALHRVLRSPVPCSPCPYRDCPIDHPCLRGISPDDVIAQANQLLAGSAIPCGA